MNDSPEKGVDGEEFSYVATGKDISFEDAFGENEKSDENTKASPPNGIADIMEDSPNERRPWMADRNLMATSHIPSTYAHACISENAFIEARRWNAQTLAVENMYSGRNLPPRKDYELEFVITNMHQRFLSPGDDEPIYSDCHYLPNFKFRVMVYFAHAKNQFYDYSGPWMSMFLQTEKMEDWSDSWGFTAVNYYIAAINQRDYRESKYRDDKFAFNSEEVDRGWREFILHSDVLNNHFLTDDDSLVIRAGACPVGCETDRVIGEHSYISRPKTGFVGLRNHGATCYMNALLQILYHIGSFRKAVFQLTFKDQTFGSKTLKIFKQKQKSSKKRTCSGYDVTMDDESGYNKSSIYNRDMRRLTSAFSENPKEEYREAEFEGSSTGGSESESCSIDDFADLTDQDFREILKEEEEEKKRSPRVSLALQNLFYKLFNSETAVACKELIRSFGWGAADAFTQQDTHELLKLLLDKVEEQMLSTSAEGCVKDMFRGYSETYIECIDIDYKSSRPETFEDIQLDVRGCRDIFASLRKATAAEVLEGDNMYEAEGHGKQRARKGIRFQKLPPVVIILLKRFDYDLNQMDTVKVNDRFEFTKEIDFSEFCPDAGVYILQAVAVHQGDINSGHYYSFCRSPDLKEWHRFDDEKVYKVREYAAIEENFGGEEGQIWNYFESSQKPSPRHKTYNAYILSYVKKEVAEELLAPCDPRSVNQQLVERCQMEEKLRDRRIMIRKMLSKNIKLHIFEPSAFEGKRFMQLPFRDGKESYCYTFSREESRKEVTHKLLLKFRELPGLENSYIYFYVITGNEHIFRFDKLLFPVGKEHPAYMYAPLTLQQLFDELAVKELKDPVDPRLYILAVPEPVHPEPFINYIDFAHAHTLIVNKYFDPTSDLPSEECLLCLNFLHVKADERLRTVADHMLELIARYAQEKKITTPSSFPELPAFYSSVTAARSSFSNVCGSGVHPLRCFVELESEPLPVMFGRSMKQNKIIGGDSLVWSIAPSSKASEEKKLKMNIGKNPSDLELTAECEAPPGFVLPQNFDLAATAALQSLPTGFAGFCPPHCPLLPTFLVHDFNDFILKKRSAVTLSIRLYDPLLQLGKHQNVNGLLFEDYNELLRDDSDVLRSPEGNSSLESLTKTLSLPSTDSQMPLDEDIYLLHPSGKPLIMRSFDLDLRMPIKQVVKYVAWHLNVDPSFLLLFSEPPLMSSPASSGKQVDWNFARDFAVRECKDNDPILKWWIECSKAIARRALPPAMHLAILHTHYSNWLGRGAPLCKIRSHFIIQLFNSKVEVVWAFSDILSHIGPPVERLTAKDLIEYVRTKIPSHCEALGISKDTDLRLINIFGENRFEVYPSDMKLMEMDWFCNERFVNTFRFPLRLEPMYSLREQTLVSNGFLKEVTVIHKTPPPDRDISGYPFQILVKPFSTLAEIKVIIKQKLQLPEKYWSQYRGWFQLDPPRKIWKANSDCLDWIYDKAILVVEHNMPYSKIRNQTAMKIG